MNRAQKLWISAGLLLLITLVGVSIDILQPPQAPAAVFKTIDNEIIQLDDLRGNPVLITFWATDCRSCVQEIPHLIDLYRRFHPSGLEIIAVAMYYDPPSHVVAMQRVKQIPYPVALDLRRQLSAAFGDVRLTPTSFLIDPQGNIALQTTGQFDIEDMAELIESLIIVS